MKTILITLDCARADWLECNGGRREWAPYLNSLAEKGVIFKNAITSNNSTAPSHVSILTSTYSPTHGVKGNGMVFNCSQIPTLAEKLSEAGLTTAAFVSVEHMSSYFGLSRGFKDYYNNSRMDRFFYMFTRCKIKIFERSLLSILVTLRGRFKAFGSHSKKGARTLQQAIRWFNSNKKKDFFMWVHFFDAHHYSSRTEYEQKIRYVDDKVERILTEVYKYSSPEEVFVIIVGDHGETFEQEHGYKGHASCLYDEVIKIPLIMVLPGKIRPKIVLEQVRNIDIAPTILDFYNMEIPDNWQGISLRPFLLEQKPFKTLDALTYSYTLALHAKSIRTAKWKMIYFNELFNYTNPAYGQNGIAHPYRVELYDLQKDPQERNNLAQDNEQIIRELKARFFDLENRSSRIYTHEDLNPVIKKKLQSLGYL